MAVGAGTGEFAFGTLPPHHHIAFDRIFLLCHRKKSCAVQGDTIGNFKSFGHPR
jgi:hypothetical protein